MIRRAITTALVLMLSVSTTAVAASALTIENDSIAAVKAAESSLPQVREQLSKLVRRGQYGILGFHVPAEIDRVNLTSPLAAFDVRVSVLQSYDGGADPANLLIGIGHVFYLLVVDEHVRSLVETERGVADWKPIKFGFPALARQLSEAIRIERIPFDESPVHFVVRVPALNAMFIGRRRGTEFLLTAVTRNILGMNAGETWPAREVFRELAPLVRRLNHLPT